VRNDTLPYKLASYAARKPDIVAIGSSRAMRFREQFFLDNFYSFGGAMQSVQQGEFLVEKMLSEHRPRAVILALDFWWFHTEREDPFYYAVTPNRRLLKVRSVLEPTKWLYEGKISFFDYADTIIHGDAMQPDRIGVTARKKNTGFANDGSYYGKYQTMPRTPACNVSSAQMQRTFGKEDMWYFPKMHFDKGRIAQFVRLVRRLEDDGIDVVVVFPPLSPVAYAEMEHTDRNESMLLLHDLKGGLRDADIVFADYTNPSSLGSEYCEFLDLIHGGDVTYARLTQAIAARFDGIRIDPTFINTLIQQNIGRVIIGKPW